MKSTKLIFAILSLVICIPATAALIELPAEMPLDARSVVLNLWNADVDIQLDPDAVPTIRALPIGEEAVKADLKVSVNRQNFQVLRPVGVRGEAPRIRIEVTVGASHQLSLEGQYLAVTFRDARPPEEDEDEGEADGDDGDGDDDEDEGDEYDEDDEDDEDEYDEEEYDEEEYDQGEGSQSSSGDPSASGFSSLRLVLEDSEANLTGAHDAVLEARRTSVWLHGSQGVLNLNLEYGSAEIRGHQGHLQLEANESEVKVHDLRGDLEPQISGGSLDVRQGNGLFNGTFTGAVLLFDGWQGDVQVRGTRTTVEARGGRRPVPWILEGEGLLVTLDEMAARVTARLDGGSFDASAMSYPLTIDATNRTGVELKTLARGAKLKISNGSTVRLTDISGQVQAELHDAGLWAEGVAQLFLTTERSQVEASGIDRFLGLEMTDTDAVLDLTSSTTSPSLKLLGSGRAVVRLSAPCRVHLAGLAGADGSTANVSGCDLRLQGQPGRPIPRPSIQGARRLITLSVTLDEGVDLEVEGQP